MAKSSLYAFLPESANMYSHANALKDEKDSSKNLVSGEFEREFSGGLAQQPCRRRRTGIAVVAAAVAVLFLWLLGITIVRELQLKALRQEIDQLSANMIAIEATVKSLNLKVTKDGLYDDTKSYDTIYADDDLEDPSRSDKKHYSDLEKLDGLTVLEDDESDDEDDEDIYDVDEDAESGDWYPDYDKRRDKIGKTNMVKLKPEDFVGPVPVSLSNIKKIKQILNQNPEVPDSELAAATAPSVQATVDARAKRSVFPYSAEVAGDVDEFAAPRAVLKMEDRLTRANSVGTTVSDDLFTSKLAHSTRTTRDSKEQEGGQKRAFIAAHFHGNTSHLNPEIHEHYKGNGLVRLGHDAHHDVWYPAPWTLASRNRPTLTQNGHVHVHHTGVYLVYVQIYYLDTHDVIAWVLHRTTPYSSRRETLLQCAQSSHSTERRDRPNSCFSASALFLRKGDRLAVRNTGGDRHSVMQPEKSFIGLVQLADTTVEENEL